jgi:hypothetical protein
LVLPLALVLARRFLAMGEVPFSRVVASGGWRNKGRYFCSISRAA